MKLNKQGPGKIDYCDFTYNPISGRCQHNCPYCYMQGFWKRYPAMAELQIKEKHLQSNFPKKPAVIFTGSSTDMFGDWVPDEWIQRVLDKVRENPRHTFLFLTKNPERYADFSLMGLNNCWFGTTVDGTERTADNRHKLVWATSAYCGINRFLSFEPLLGPVESDLFGIKWIIIGANSNRGAKKTPMEWAYTLFKTAKNKGAKVWVKDNYGYPERIKEFPK
ncbi:DUF5131 family protein [Desulfospira joergensenii]|uniref:DUF5131 family protein n=1 Tax=Desulfospira joergensenii TaxID=53329 RepID=UPI0003B46A82|nr:DUF5131 family protein [Desulfospira joergensenii]